MKPAVTLLASLLAGPLLAGCGSSGGGGGGSSPISGTILGTPFTPTGEGALVSPPAPCNTGINVSLTGMVIGFTSFADACGFAAVSQLCGDKQNSLVVPLFLVRARDPGVGDVPPIGPGTYTYSASPMPDVNGIVTQVGADVVRTVDGNLCTHVASPDVTAGTLRLDTVSSTRVAGHADVTFSDGSHFAGSFDVPVCAYQPDICALVNDTCTMPSCIP